MSNFTNQIFQDLHGELDFDKLQNLGEHPELRPDNFDEVCELLEADPDGFYLNQGSIINPLVYYKDLVFYAFNIMGLTQADPDNMIFQHEIESFKRQRERFGRMLEDRDYDSFICLQDKRVRFRLYRELFDLIPDNEKFSIFEEVYVMGEYGFADQDPDFMRKVFETRFKDAEWKPFRYRFPDTENYVTVYRGTQSKSSPLDKAYSWTLDKEKAQFFASRFADYGKLHEAEVYVDKIITYLDARGEKEVLILPEHIRDVRTYFGRTV
ncbi:mRNA catabolic process [Lysinibacillus phage vB_LfM_LysYB1]|nr:mRNA catabolic process [Lysinibacillus phage vB_LfM_LysYB1]WAB25307.1 mRNA catabolic process [Lysinibacillus phage vB_LfM_LysYB2]